ncbi:MAG: GNAT family N-acetyltransferase [Christensenellaceae bacterium]|jgi:GNAT superfamily N-acetyltransferase|nr:GNAT family N-acetyltransferase [Christensenellaceae bacterium]
MPEVKFSLSDVDAALSILQEAAAWLIASGKPMWKPESLTREKLNNPAEEFLVLWVEGEAAATLTLSFYDPLFWPDLPPGASGFAHKLAVRRKFAGQGLAAKLLLHAAELCRQRDVPALRLDTDADRPALHALYEGLGFRLAGTKRLVPPGHSDAFDLHLYALDLAPH